MDLVYIPEVLTYGSFRNPQYRDYEQPWNKDYFNYGKSAVGQCHPQHQQHQHQYQQERFLGKDDCHLCRESKRRSLAAYIRGKTRKNSCSEIHEEEEEEIESAEEKFSTAPSCIGIGIGSVNTDISNEKRDTGKIVESRENEM